MKWRWGPAVFPNEDKFLLQVAEGKKSEANEKRTVSQTTVNPLLSAGDGGADTPPHTCIVENEYNFFLSITFDSPQNLTTNSLLLTGSLTDSTINTYFVCHMYYILHSYNKVS